MSFAHPHILRRAASANHQAIVRTVLRRTTYERPCDRYHADVAEVAATNADNEIRVIDNPASRRYEAHLGDRILGIVEYDLDPDGNRITLIHTEVLESAEGMGVGSRLAKGVLADLRERRLDMTVECEFISAYLKRHSREYEDLVRD
jgi:predicted GNAT family acetyltransferase